MRVFILILLNFFFIGKTTSSYKIYPIEFKYNSTEISAAELIKLKNAAATLNVISEGRNGAKFTLWIDGHANSTELNPKRLARIRAKTIRDHLVKFKLPKLKIVVQSFGSEKPMTDPNSENGSSNQRVEFKMN